MTRFLAAEHTKTLAGFQRATVDHVMRRFYDSQSPTRRFLVADETGLGKSIVARGVVAEVIERLQDDPSVDRIDIIYVCSNADIARQNLARLNVIGQEHAVASRITMLAKTAQALDGAPVAGDKAVNLIAFTPGTLPGNAAATGRVEERALIQALLEQFVEPRLNRQQVRASSLLLQGGVTHVDTLRRHVESITSEAEASGGLDEEIATAFIRRCENSGLMSEYLETLAEIGGALKRLPSAVQERANRMIASFRTELARAGVNKLQPDLIILDEFQRFRDLIDPQAENEGAQLARSLFDFGDARVLLLSATPIKSFTLAEEAQTGEDHERDLGKLLEFLTSGSSATAAEIVAELSAYRRCAINGEDVSIARRRVEERLLSVMCRTERPRVGTDGILAEEEHPVDQLTPEDFVGWVALHDLAEVLDAPVSLEYWKSAPYFANFLDGYKVGEELRTRIREGKVTAELRHALRRVQKLDAGAVQNRQPIKLGNARLKSLADRTTSAGFPEMLWVPGSLRYHEVGGPFRNADAVSVSKHLLFSSWSATPTAVASLLSYAADREIGTDPDATTRLDFRVDDDRPGAMTTLALLWPTPGLAALCDPLELARADASSVLPIAAALERATSLVAGRLPTLSASGASAAESAYWEASVGAFGRPPLVTEDAVAVAAALSGQTDAEEDADAPSRLRRHVDLALERMGGFHATESPADLNSVVASIGLWSPGNIAWRALGRLLRPGHVVTPTGHWLAAATLASGFRSLFTRVEAMAILDGEDELRALPYWRAILQYCGWGDLQAVLDEHVYHLANAEGLLGAMSDEGLLRLATAVRNALTLRPSVYLASDPSDPDSPRKKIRFTSRFALRYGTARQADDAARLPEIRGAFNSPFWPWVLATTSVGQEGIDFHWWCNTIVHWNTPPNPVDFDQREGRVNRFGSLTVRRNLAVRHRAEIVQTCDGDPWGRAYELGCDERVNLGELAPQWVYPGPSKIRRIVMPYPLSTDGARYRQLKDDLALYRLTFGQPRQEDLLDILKRRGVQHDPDRIKELQLSLAPPRKDLQ